MRMLVGHKPCHKRMQKRTVLMRSLEVAPIPQRCCHRRTKRLPAMRRTWRSQGLWKAGTVDWELEGLGYQRTQYMHIYAVCEEPFAIGMPPLSYYLEMWQKNLCRRMDERPNSGPATSWVVPCDACNGRPTPRLVGFVCQEAKAAKVQYTKNPKG